jgi:hypothetical protein
MNKLIYEIKHRKKEFLNECVKFDTDFQSKLSLIYFEILLDKFTCYPSRHEKNEILKKLAINDAYVNYITVCNISPSEDEDYTDPFLIHLNDLRKKSLNKSKIIHLKNDNVKNQIVDLTPLQLLNYQINEENFMISIAKRVMEYILLNSNNKTSEECLEETFKQNDFDMDSKYTIGEMNLFLNKCKIQLPDSELKYLFESFLIENGRINKSTWLDFIFQTSQLKYQKEANTDFSEKTIKIFKEEEVNEEKKVNEIIKKNTFIRIIFESLQVLGKIFLLKYFSKYLEIFQNKLFIDSVWLEVGYKKLGYNDISPNELGNFKFFIIKKQIGILKNGLSLSLDLEYLFDFIINYFRMEEIKNVNESGYIVEEINKKLLKDMNNNILSQFHHFATNKGGTSINEFEFRKKFISAFNLKDHYFLDHMVNFLIQQQENDKTKVYENKITETELNEEFEQKVFNLEKINDIQWLKTCYNFIFMGMIKFHDQLGLMLELPEIVQLKNIYNNMENKLFPKKRLTQKVYSTVKYGSKDLVISSDKTESRTKGIQLFNDNENDLRSYIKMKKLYETKKAEKENKLIAKQEEKIINNQNTGIEIINNIQLQQGNNNSTMQIRQNPNSIQFIKPHTINLYNLSDTSKLLPELYSFCSKYLVNKFNLDDPLNSDLAAKLGICRIFRENLQANKVNTQQDTNLFILMGFLKPLFGENEELYKFFELLASKEKNSSNSINPNFFFFRLEDLLLKYSKINQ